MKVLIYDTNNAFHTFGGKTTHALKMQQEISKLGIDIQFAQWWNKSQENADIIHFLTPDIRVARLAKQKGMKTILSFIFDFESNKSEWEKRKAILKNKIYDKLPGQFGLLAYWKAFPYMDRIHFMHQYDKENAFRYFPNYLNENKSVLIPHAYDTADMYISKELDIQDMKLPDKYLISVANISYRKQSIKLAQYAKKAQTPIVFIGSGNKQDDYFRMFQKEIDNQYVFYPGYISKEWKDCIEAHASGYVLLSLGESGCIAVYEAAAYRIPLLLSNLPWAWGYENPTDIYLCKQEDEITAIHQLKEFYNKSRKMDHFPFTAYTWAEVALQYKEQYEQLLKS